MATIDHSRFLQPDLEIILLASITPDNNKCSICHRPFFSNSPNEPLCTEPRRLVECGHIFCHDSIDQWFGDTFVSTCPTCSQHYYPVRTAPPPPPRTDIIKYYYDRSVAGMLSALVFSMIIQFIARLIEHVSLRAGMFEGALADAGEKARWVLYLGVTIAGTSILWNNYRRIVSSLRAFGRAFGTAVLAFYLFVYLLLSHNDRRTLWGLFTFGG